MCPDAGENWYVVDTMGAGMVGSSRHFEPLSDSKIRIAFSTRILERQGQAVDCCRYRPCQSGRVEVVVSELVERKSHHRRCKSWLPTNTSPLVSGHHCRMLL